jgi:flavin-dependent dehydrogenase
VKREGEEKIPNENYDVIVIGSGPGGLSAATLLQKRGLDCLLIDKNNLLGGKMISIEKDGYAYDLFPHGSSPCSTAGATAESTTGSRRARPWPIPSPSSSCGIWRRIKRKRPSR